MKKIILLLIVLMQANQSFALDLFALIFVLSACSSHKLNSEKTATRQNVNIREMDEEERNEYLTNTAKEIYKTYPEYYREDAEITIEKKKTSENANPDVVNRYYNNPDSPWYGMRPNQTYYSVKFEIGEYDDEDPLRWLPVTIYIREDTGKAFRIQLNNMIYPLK